jgi:hypothetical protein
MDQRKKPRISSPAASPLKDNDLLNPVFSAVPRSAITNKNHPFRPVTIVELDGTSAAGTLFPDMNFFGTLTKMRNKLSTMAEELSTVKEEQATMAEELSTVKEEQATQDQRILFLETEAALLKCSICYEARKNTRISCGHLYCDKCLENLGDDAATAPGSVLKCPRCREPAGDQWCNPETNSPVELIIL